MKIRTKRKGETKKIKTNNKNNDIKLAGGMGKKFKNLRKKSIKNQIVFLFLIFTIVPVIMNAILSYYFISNNVIENIKDSNVRLVSSLSDQIDSFIENTFNVIESSAETNDFISMDKTEGEIKLNSIIKRTENILSIHIYDMDGNPIMSTLGVDKVKNIKGESWFDTAKNGKRCVTDSYLEGKVPVVSLVSPLKNSVNVQDGIIIANINLKGLTDIVQKQKIGETGITYIVDSKGTIIAHPDYKEKVIERYNGISHKLQGAIDVLNEKNKNNDFYLNEKGKEVLGCFTKISSTGWGIILEQDKEEINGIVMSGFKGTIYSTIIILFIVIAISAYEAKKLSDPVEKLAVVAGKIGEGDLREKVKVDSENEIGQLERSFNAMVDSLYDVVLSAMDTSQNVKTSSNELLENADMVISAASEITGVIEEVSKGTEDQIKKVDNTTKEFLEISSIVKDIEKNFSYILNSSNNAYGNAKKGSSDVQETITSMNSISQKVVDSAQKMNVLKEYTNDINNTVSLINNISKQTNLLALNAAIEAARAGEAGKGFTVVAEEVRKLSEETDKASKNIVNVTNKIQYETDNVIKSMVDGVTEVEKGNKIIKRTSSTFESIMKGTEYVTVTVENFKKILEKLSEGIENVNSSIREVSKIAEETSAGTETVLASTEEQEAYLHSIKESVENLKSMSEDLAQILLKFKME